MDPEMSEALRKKHRMVVFFSCWMIVSLLAYAGVVEYIVRTNAGFRGFSPLNSETFSILWLVVLSLALVDLILIPIVRNRALSDTGGAAGAASEVSLSNRLDRLVNVTIVTSALCGSIAIGGLVLFLLNGARSEFYLFLGISFIAFIIHFPRLAHWEKWLQDLNRERRIL